ncbi:ATP-binding cassette domain-containing protein [Tritonibacter mobilis]|nr:ATP-binding cassette domain-containing protein [Tritonibacter mobilis]
MQKFYSDTPLKAAQIKEEVLSLFKKVQLPDPQRVYTAYPHELSGGQKQRVVIAIAIACKPKLLIADEPTTALDVTVQKEILELLKTLQQEYQMSILFISHDLALVSEIADNVLVLYRGKMVELGTVNQIFIKPEEEYTRALIYARPALDVRLKRLPTIKDYLKSSTYIAETYSQSERAERHKKLYSHTPLLKVVALEKWFTSRDSWFHKKITKAVNDVSFSLFEGETLGLVGESGCGKSTLGNTILQLTKANKGEVFYKGIDITKISTNEMRILRKEIQVIFQDPFASLNPRLTIGAAIMEPMKAHNSYKNTAQRAR